MHKPRDPFTPGTSHKQLRTDIQVCLWVAVGVMVTILWANEIFDLPHYLFGVPATPINWVESIFETVALGIVGGIVVVMIRTLLGRIHYLEGFLHVCTFCKRIYTGDRWVTIEQYIVDHSEAVVSHSYCPDCAREHYGIISEEPGEH